jgi:hypothetical protein
LSRLRQPSLPPHDQERIAISRRNHTRAAEFYDSYMTAHTREFLS